MKKQDRIISTVLFLAAGLAFSFRIQAAALVFQPEAAEARAGDVIKAALVLDTQGQDINALGGEIEFPADLLSWEGASEADSILNFWVENPQKPEDCASVCRVAFSGVVPGGFNDRRGLVLTAVFKAKQEGQGEVRLKSIEALLNDGRATSVKTSDGKLSFVIKADAPLQAISEKPDIVPPEAFRPEITKSANLFEGQWFAVFATQDKTSGIDHYELAEHSKPVPESDYGALSWNRAESPFLLEDQSLQSYIYIKAADKQGNFRIARILPLEPKSRLDTSYIWAIMLIVAVVGGIFAKTRLHLCRNKQK
jgi:hypothetical protein